MIRSPNKCNSDPNLIQSVLSDNTSPPPPNFVSSRIKRKRKKLFWLRTKKLKNLSPFCPLNTRTCLEKSVTLRRYEKRIMNTSSDLQRAPVKLELRNVPEKPAESVEDLKNSVTRICLAKNLKVDLCDIDIRDIHRLGVLSKERRYFTPGHRLQLYKAQIWPHMEYCFHLWGLPSTSSLHLTVFNEELFESSTTNPSPSGLILWRCVEMWGQLHLPWRVFRGDLVWKHRKVFRSYKLRFHVPKKDLCKKCVAFKDIKSNATISEDANNSKHLKRRDDAFLRRDADKAAANNYKNVLAFNFDLQAVLHTLQLYQPL
ncbi:unnamed protein product [Pieris macdunnoughi]|uniref:Uncharacterized protein n=1 Tax=Pieris macdunnoughi TaxID=345717 RepID=A0A821XDZ1_9NEOP|nr:unnamed protein product [Pieris macdunnoughi]